MIHIIIIFILILIIIFLNNRERFQTLSSEVFNNIQVLCNKDGSSYFNNLDIGSSSQINNKNIYKYIIDYLYPIGSFYIQYPDSDTKDSKLIFPDSKSPNNLFQGTKWQKQWDNESIFFRTEGELSTLVSRNNGLQEYALKKIYGKMSWVQSDRWNVDNKTGVFGRNDVRLPSIVTEGGTGDDLGYRDYFAVDSVLDSKNISNDEVRVKNRLMIVWKRTA